MPGFWFPIESSEVDHLLSQFRLAIENAIEGSKPEELQIMRSNAVTQRFPVQDWLNRLMNLYQRINFDFYDENVKKSMIEETKICVEPNHNTNEHLYQMCEYLVSIVERHSYPEFSDVDGELEKNFSLLLESSTLNSIDEISITKVIKKKEDQYYLDSQNSQILSNASEKEYPEWRSFLTLAMQHRFYGWPIYTLILLLGQLLSVTSFQLVLLSDALKLSKMVFYLLGSVFVLFIFVWGYLYGTVQSRYVLVLPFFCFGISAMLLAIPGDIFLLKATALGLYTAGTSAGTFFFALSFGQESGVKLKSWVYRAIIGEVFRQIWMVGFWYYNQRSESGADITQFDLTTIGAIVLLILGILFVCLGLILVVALPNCYSYSSPIIPGFFRNLLKRKLVLWFWIAEFGRSYLLSSTYGRNWTFLWSQPINASSVLLICFVFGVIWIFAMRLMARQSEIHSWILPLFAVGLLAPKWAQMSFSTSLIGSYLPWAGDGGTVCAISLWMWLGLLDTIQAVGFTIMLLQTLTRIHVVAVLGISQILTAIAQMLAFSTAPNSNGPGSMFPNITLWNTEKFDILQEYVFYLVFLSQIVIALGFLFFFRVEQLSKP
jgi:alpha-1,3-glucan synthase